MVQPLYIFYHGKDKKMALVIDEKKLSEELVKNLYDQKIFAGLTLGQILVLIPVAIVLGIIIGRKIK